jgi:hypothetical protein
MMPDGGGAVQHGSHALHRLPHHGRIANVACDGLGPLGTQLGSLILLAHQAADSLPSPQ